MPSATTPAAVRGRCDRTATRDALAGPGTAAPALCLMLSEMTTAGSAAAEDAVQLRRTLGRTYAQAAARAGARSLNFGGDPAQASDGLLQ
jgi:hypothetical protein